MQVVNLVTLPKKMNVGVCGWFCLVVPSSNLAVARTNRAHLAATTDDKEKKKKDVGNRKEPPYIVVVCLGYTIRRSPTPPEVWGFDADLDSTIFRFQIPLSTRKKRSKKCGTQRNGSSMVVSHPRKAWRRRRRSNA